MKEHDSSLRRIERAQITDLDDIVAFYACCQETTAQRGKAIDWKGIDAERVAGWIAQESLYQIMTDEKILGHTDSVCGYRVATAVLSPEADPRVWTAEEVVERPASVYLSKLALNKWLMGDYLLRYLMPTFEDYAMDQGYDMLRFDHIPALNDLYDRPELGFANVGSATFDGQEDEVYVVKRQKDLRRVQ